MIVYLFDAIGLYLGSYEPQENPLEPGEYIIPIDSTLIVPPSLTANQAAQFASGAWNIVADYRGQTWFDSSSGAPVVINEIGQPAPNLVQEYIAPMPTIAALQTQVNATADSALRAALIAKGIIAQADIDLQVSAIAATLIKGLSS